MIRYLNVTCTPYVTITCNSFTLAPSILYIINLPYCILGSLRLVFTTKSYIGFIYYAYKLLKILKYKIDFYYLIKATYTYSMYVLF